MTSHKTQRTKGRLAHVFGIFYRTSDRTRMIKDRLAYILGIVCVVIAAIPLVSILAEAVTNGIGAISPQFFTSIPGIPYQSIGGVGPAIQGTLLLVGLASLIGIPPGVLAGIYLAEYGNNRFGRTVRFLNDVLTEFPSIVVGILIWVLLVVATHSYSPVSGAIALAIIMLPIVTRTTEESIKTVPNSIRDAAMALGIRRWRTTISVVLSTARSGVVTGILLSVARIAGESAPLLLTILGSGFFFSSWSQPIDALPLRIYHDAFQPDPQSHERAWGAALILIMLALSLNVGVRYATRGRYDSTKLRI
jgi:phosphate transport system permease protein